MARISALLSAALALAVGLGGMVVAMAVATKVASTTATANRIDWSSVPSRIRTYGATCTTTTTTTTSKVGDAMRWVYKASLSSLRRRRHRRPALCSCGSSGDAW